MEPVKIPLGKSGEFAIIDRDDETIVRRYSWSIHRKDNNRYARTQLVRPDGSHHWLRMHVLIMNPPPGMEVDHKDRDGLNNRRSNLRIATRQQNRANSRQRARKNPYKGIFWVEEKAKWRANIRVNGVKKHLGYFRDPVEAGRAYDRAAREAFGEFAVCNFPE